ncbi:hypothetical protein GQ457_03G025760 [Hibiscus cannabinus]
MGGRRHRKKGLPSPLYAANSTKFTAVLHHGGFFSNTRTAKYNGKKIDYFDFCDVDEMSVFELVDMVQNLGIKRPVKLFRIALDGAKKILPLCSDSDVMNMLGDLPRNHHVHIFLVEQTFEPQFENELPTKPESEPHVIVDEPHTEAEVEPQIETDVETEIEIEPLVESETEIEPPVGPEIETEPPAVEPESVVETEPVEPEPSIEPPVGPEIEIETEPSAVEPEPVVETEPVEHEPSIEREPLVESNEFEDSDYNGSVRSESVTSEFDDSDFSVEDMSQFHVDAGIDFEGNVRVSPSVGKERIDSESETEVSDSLHSPNESDSDSGKKKKQRFTEFNSATDMDNPELKVGMVFADREVLKEAIKNYSLQNKYKIRFKFNDKRRVKAVCKPGCPWVVWGARLNPHDPLDNTWQIKTMNSQHSCSKEYKNLNLSSKIIAKKYLHLFVADRNLKPRSLREAVIHDYIYPVPLTKCYRAKQFAIELIEGKHKSQYSRIYDYLSELRLTNPGTTTVCQLDDRVFQRMYICLQACKEGFKSCRPIICLDGCHLKGYHQGHLLAAVGVDANDCIYPIAFAVVDSENHSSWCWFLEILAKDLELTNSHYVSFMTDKQKGLVEGLPEIFPHSEHRTCVRHLYMNFKLKFTGKALKDALWKAARATYLREFEVALAELKTLSPKAHEWLAGKDPRNWSKSHFSCNSKCDMVLNNLYESFNKFILDARDKPIITMLEIIRTKIMQRIAKKKDEADKWSTVLCPKIQKKLDAAIESSNRCWPTHAGGYKFQISCGPHTQHAVDLSEHTCSCRKWQLTGIPCHHAISAIFLLDQRPDAFVDVCYKTITQQAIYSHMIEPVRGLDQWTPDTTCLPILPPVQKRPPGRPQKNRKKEVDEKNDHSRKVGKKGLRMTCSKCGQSGHNVRTCKGVIGGNTQPSRGRTVPKLPVKRPFGGIRIQDETTSIPSEQVPHHHRPSTQPPPITVVRMMMNSGNNSMSQPTTATSNFPPNDQ